MGIDVFMAWSGGGALHDQDYSRLLHGRDGYLREAYHGGPYATPILVPEAFGDAAKVSSYFARVSPHSEHALDAGDGWAAIPAHVLRERLAQTLLTVAERWHRVYDEECDEGHEALREFVEFVELAERIEVEHGEAVRVRASY